MSRDEVLLAYKLVCLLVGAAMAWLGYRLYSKGVTANAGSLDGTAGGIRVVLTNAAPGTFFVVAGVVIVMMTVWKGITFDSDDSEVVSKPAPAAVSNPAPAAESAGGGEAVGGEAGGVDIRSRHHSDTVSGAHVDPY